MENFCLALFSRISLMGKEMRLSQLSEQITELFVQKIHKIKVTLGMLSFALIAKLLQNILLTIYQVLISAHIFIR